MAPDQPFDGARISGAEVLGPVATSSLTCAILDVNFGSHLVFSAVQVLKDRGVGNCECERLSQDWSESKALNTNHLRGLYPGRYWPLSDRVQRS